jgi:general secretion pathway protein K
MRTRGTIIASAPRKRGSIRQPDGFVLVAVLWILLLLATLATIYSVYVGNSALALGANDAGIENELLTTAGVELAAYQLAASEKETRPTRGQFKVRLGHAILAVRFVSESARIDLNEAPKRLLAGLFAALGAHAADAERYADRVIGWRTEPKAGAQDNEAALYRAAGLSYSPRGGPFADVSELWLVEGLPPALVERAMPFVTIYSGQPAVNVLDAAPEVLAALPDMTADRLDAILNRRETATAAPRSAADVLGADVANATTKGSDAYRIDVRITYDDGGAAASEVVILPAEEVPYHVLSWRDSFDAAASRSAGIGLR